jgi:hypothetical protein
VNLLYEANDLSSQEAACAFHSRGRMRGRQPPTLRAQFKDEQPPVVPSRPSVTQSAVAWPASDVALAFHRSDAHACGQARQKVKPPRGTAFGRPQNTASDCLAVGAVSPLPVTRHAGQVSVAACCVAGGRSWSCDPWWPPRSGRDGPLHTSGEAPADTPHHKRAVPSPVDEAPMSRRRGSSTDA